MRVRRAMLIQLRNQQGGSHSGELGRCDAQVVRAQ
eukprot:COSAG01_NODE_46728_length_396_cov_1.184564_1_plen_34_part_01